MKIQQIPAPTFAEGQRAEYLRAQFLAEGLSDVTCDTVGNVYARLEGNGSAAPVVISAHLDTVFPASTDLSVQRNAERIAGPGIGDNSLGVAGLLGLIWTFREQGVSLPGDLWLVANVCEEGLGDLRGMRAVVDRFSDQVLAYLILEGLALGHIYHRGLGVQRFRITVNTTGGHSWVDYGRPSAVHELAALVTRLAALPLSAEPRTTLNVGTIGGGTSINTIAAEAHLELDLRSEGEQALSDLAAQVRALVQAANQPAVQVDAEVIGTRPTGKLSANHALVRLARRRLEEQGYQPTLGIGSTDANIPLSRGLPAICLGLSSGGGSHTLGEYILTEPLPDGLTYVASVIEGAFRELA